MTRSLPPVLLTAALGLSLLACGDDGSAGETDDPTTDSGGVSATGTDSAPGTTASTVDPDGTTSGTTAGPGTSTGDPTGEPTSESGSSGEVVCDADTIELPGDDFYPEGIASDAAGNLYITSIATGAVVMADSCDGEVTELIAPGEGLVNPVGLIVVESAGALVICSSDFSFATPPSIDVRSIEDGSPIAQHTFDAPGFCNDLTLDDEGNVYVTDSGGARILRVAAADLLSDGPAQTWATDPDFMVGKGEFGLNGIAFDGDSSIYVVNSAQGALHQVAIEPDGSAGAITPISIEVAPLAAPDGLEWLEDGTMLVVEGGLQAVSRITLAGGSATVQVLADGFDTPTTSAMVGSDVWVVEGQLDHLLGFDPQPPQVPFVVQRWSR